MSSAWMSGDRLIQLGVPSQILMGAIDMTSMSSLRCIRVHPALFLSKILSRRHCHGIDAALLSSAWTPHGMYSLMSIWWCSIYIACAIHVMLRVNSTVIHYDSIYSIHFLFRKNLYSVSSSYEDFIVI